MSSQFLDVITYKELYITLKTLFHTDNYLSDCLGNDVFEELIYLLEVYNLVWIASDDRVLLTTKGEKVLQDLILTVDLSKKASKVNTPK